MTYRDLVNFDKITSIIKLGDSADTEKATELVRNYVISDAMAVRIREGIFAQLRWDNPVEHFGLLVIGNYGTGKSHLLSVISSVASDAGMVRHLRNKSVRDAAAAIAGKFQVIRCELGAVTTPLRTIFANKLQEFLDENGIDFAIPAADAGLPNNKGWIEDMMAAFHQKFPDHGLLFVVDEMLDYLRGLNERELTQAFGLMREIGEIAQSSRFRFIAGVQEAIFDSGRFSFVSDSLARVAKRFFPVTIERNDVKYVVSERLLSKTAEQRETIRKHLDPFAPFFGDMASRMDDFCAMFPVHPDYIEVFGRIACTERREVLKTLSNTIERMLDTDVPEDDPGIVAFDSYWNEILATPALQAVPEIKTVTDCAKVLADKVGTLNKAYAAPASRALNALAVFRLCTGDIEKHIGLTAENLRDMLCIFDPVVRDMGGDGAVILRENIATAIEGLMQAVDGQFLSKNADNGQYFIDVKKTIDVEAIIRKRAESLDDESLDRAYYELLKVAMEVVDLPTKVTGYKIWEFDDLQWFSRKAPRRGYLFFGAPNERSTAQPPRDYYIYFTGPFAPVKFKDEKKADEVFFRLTRIDEAFRENIRLYAAALEMANTSSGEMKQNYVNRSNAYMKKALAWLLGDGRAAYEVTYRGERKKPAEWLTGVSLRDLLGVGANGTFNFRDMILALSGYIFDGHFAELAPEYPKFQQYISRKARPGAIADALGVLCGGAAQQGRIVLGALSILEGGSIDPSRSPYATRVLNMLKDLPEGQVLRRDALLETIHQDSYFEPRRFRLEDDLFVVVIAALVSTGDIVLTTLGHTFDASSMEMLAATSLPDLLGFAHISRPKTWNSETIAAVFDLLGLKKGLVAKAVIGSPEPVTAMLDASQRLASRLAAILPKLSRPLMFAGTDLLQLSGAANAAQPAAEAKSFLEHLLNFNTPNKLKQLQMPASDIAAHKQVVADLGHWERLFEFCRDNGALLNYLEGARRELPPDDAWSRAFEKTLQGIREKLPALLGPAAIADFLEKASAGLGKLKADYITQYRVLHDKARLNLANDAKRQKLLTDPRMKTLSELAAISIMPRARLDKLRTQIEDLKTCHSCTEAEIENETTCPHCHYSPVHDGTGKTASELLKGCDAQLSALLDEWAKIIADTLGKPEIKDAVALLDPRKKSAVDKFARSGDLPQPVPQTLLDGLREALNGLQKVTLRADDLLDTLRKISPTGIGEFEAQLRQFVDKAVQGRDRAKVRIVVE